MAFNSLIARAVSEATSYLRTQQDLNVIELGNQSFRVNQNSLNDIASSHKIDPNELLGSQPSSPTSMGFYKALGYQDYLAIDVNSERHAVPMDLNTDIQKEYDFHHTYSLVTNNGTGEHVFDQSAVFRNMHNLTKVGGIMINVLPFISWLNHGFYTYHPVLFRDLAYANNYAWKFFWIGNNEGKYFACDPNDAAIWREAPWNLTCRTALLADPETNPKLETLLQKLRNKLPSLFRNRQHTSYSGDSDQLARYLFERAKKGPSGDLETYLTNALTLEPFNLSIVTAYQRTTSEDFVTPFTGKYKSVITSSGILKSYENQPDTYQIHEATGL